MDEREYKKGLSTYIWKWNVFENCHACYMRAYYKCLGNACIWQHTMGSHAL
jgi:hypothetical protein